MKITAIVLVCLFVYVKTESCTTGADACRATMCSTGLSVHCVDNLCTCLYNHSHQACSTKADCASSTPSDHSQHCRMDALGQPITHCVDGECHCEHNSHNHGH